MLILILDIGFSINLYMKVARINETIRLRAFALLDSCPITIDEKLIKGQCTR